MIEMPGEKSNIQVVLQSRVFSWFSGILSACELIWNVVDGKQEDEIVLEIQAPRSVTGRRRVLFILSPSFDPT